MFKAVLFDLYNTLAYIPQSEYQSAKRRMAKLAGVPEKMFIELWRQYSRLSNRGDILTIEERVALVLRDLEIIPTRTSINAIAAVEHDLQENKLRLGRYTVRVLSQLKNRGLKCGLISNTGCFANSVPDTLNIRSFFDTVIFSFSARSLKPGSLIYNKACKELSVTTDSCIYVGDGDDMEIEAAHQLGMYSVLLDEQRKKHTYSSGIQNYDKKISNLTELINIVDQLLNHQPK
jgi:HAD superfamily hydrolase (TIGR01509 family)